MGCYLDQSISFGTINPEVPDSENTMSELVHEQIASEFKKLGP